MSGILNYSTTVAADKSAAEIQRALAKGGASSVLVEYHSGTAVAISFRIQTAGRLLSFRLPSNWLGVHEVMRRQKIPQRLKTEVQAHRVAWRILKDWVEAQVAIIQSGLAEPAEVFLPYAQNERGKTVYEAMKETGFLQLNTPMSKP